MKIVKIYFTKHPLFPKIEFDFRNKEGGISNIAIIAGENGTGKTFLLESLASIVTRFNDNQAPQVTIFDYELTDEEFKDLLSEKIDENKMFLYNKNRIIVETVSFFK